METSVPQLSGNRLDVLEQIVESLKPRPLSVLEIGSYEGGSTLHFCTFIERHCGSGRIHCIDPWVPYLAKSAAGNEQARQMENELTSGAAYERFQRNIKLAPPTVPITWFRGTLAEYLETGSEIFDIVFIDGEHTYEAVLNDLRLSAPLLEVGGIMCGDDLEIPVGVGRHSLEAIRTIAEHGIEYIDNCHPGVSLAVHEFFEGQIWGRNAVWAMRKTNEGWEPFL